MIDHQQRLEMEVLVDVALGRARMIAALDRSKLLKNVRVHHELETVGAVVQPALARIAALMRESRMAR